MATSINLKISKEIQIIYNTHKCITFQGPIASFVLKFPKEKGIEFSILKNKITLFSENKVILKSNASILKRQLKGIVQPFRLQLQIKGTGYRLELSNKSTILEIKTGYSCPIFIKIPLEIKSTVLAKTNILILISHDWLSLTQFVSVLKQNCPVNPYTGQGIFIKGEKIRQKEGKKSKR